jgi:hypothetical protein
MPARSSVQIEARELWLDEYRTEEDEDDAVRTPVEAARLPADPAELADLNLHVHGRLRIEIDGRELPHLGFFGPDDVCLYTWVPELARIRSALAGGDARYVFDEGEQGQPAFVFERVGETVYVSIEDSRIAELSGGHGDAEWQRVPCIAADLFEAIDRFFVALRAQMLAAGPYGAHWWAVMNDQFDLEAPAR